MTNIIQAPSIPHWLEKSRGSPRYKLPIKLETASTTSIFIMFKDQATKAHFSCIQVEWLTDSSSCRLRVVILVWRVPTWSLKSVTNRWSSSAWVRSSANWRWNFLASAAASRLRRCSRSSSVSRSRIWKINEDTHQLISDLFEQQASAQQHSLQWCSSIDITQTNKCCGKPEVHDLTEVISYLISRVLSAILTKLWIKC